AGRLLTWACAPTQVNRIRSPTGIETFMMVLLHEMAAVCRRTLGISRAWKLKRGTSVSCKASAGSLCSAGCAPWGRGGGPAHTTTPDPLYAPACPFHNLIECFAPDYA